MKRVQYGKRFFMPVVVVVSVLVGMGANTSPSALAASETEQSDDQAIGELPVMTIDGDSVSLGYLQAVLAQDRPAVRGEPGTAEKRTAMVDKLIRMELLAKEAERRGFDKHDEVASVRKNQLASLMHKRIANSFAGIQPSEDDLKAYYQQNYATYHKPEKVRARHILISEKPKAEKLLKEMQRDKISQLEFRRLAQEHSEDGDTRTNGGDLAFFTKVEDRKEGDSEIDPEVVKAAFSLNKSGEIYPKLVHSSKGYHIVMRTGHRDKMNISFEKARDRLATLVGREKRKERIGQAIDGLREGFEVQVFEENLKYVVIDLSGGPVKPDRKGGMIENSRSFLPSGKLPKRLKKSGK